MPYSSGSEITYRVRATVNSPRLDKWHMSQSSVHELALGKYDIVLFYYFHGYDFVHVIKVKECDVPMWKSYGKFASISITAE